MPGKSRREFGKTLNKAPSENSAKKACEGISKTRRGGRTLILRVRPLSDKEEEDSPPERKQSDAQRKLKQTRLSVKRRTNARTEKEQKRRRITESDEEKVTQENSQPPAAEKCKPKKPPKRKRSAAPKKYLQAETEPVEHEPKRRKIDEESDNYEQRLSLPEVKKVGRPKKCAIDHHCSDFEHFVTKQHTEIMRATREQVKERALEKDLFYPNSDYMDKQDDTVFNEGRRIQFVKVIGEICNSIDARKHTYHLSVRLIDRYASKVKLDKDFVCVVPFAAFSIASKYIGRRSYSMATYSSNFSEVKNAKQVIELERHILEMVDFRVDDILPIAFAERFFLFAACELKRHLKADFKKKSKKNETAKSDQSTRITNIVTRFLLLNWYLLELLSVDYDLLKFVHKPHLFPATCIYAACKWTKRLPWGPSKENEDKMFNWILNLGEKEKDNLITMVTQAAAHHDGLTENAKLDIATKFQLNDQQVSEVIQWVYSGSIKDESALLEKEKGEQTFKKMLCDEMHVEEEELQPIYELLVKRLKSSFPEDTGVFEKYNNAKRGQISKKIKDFVRRLP